MRIDEIVKKQPTEYDNVRSQITSKLKSLGYTLSGTGMDSMIWSKDVGSVIKMIIPYQQRAERADSSFLLFYQFCQENKDSPYLPKFVDIGGEHHTVFEFNGQQYRQIAMEKLKPIPKNTLLSKIYAKLTELVGRDTDWEKIKIQLMDPYTWTPMHQYATYSTKPIKQMLSNPETEKMYEGLYEIMKKLSILGYKNRSMLDRNPDNLMLRGNTPVIIDPWYN
jgi:hypothetical protein